MCGEPIADEHGHLVDLESRSLHVRLPRLLPAVHARGRRRRPLPGRARPLPRRSPTSSCRPAQWDALQIPVSVAFFFVNSTLDRVGGVLPEPGRRHRVAAPARHVGRAGRRRTRRSPRCEPDVEALLVRADARARTARVLPRADRRLLRAGRRAAPAVAGLRRRPRGARRARRVLRPSVAEAAAPSRSGGRSMSELALRGASAPAPSRTPPRRRCCCGCASPRPTGDAGARHRAARARSGSSRSAAATTPPRRRRLVRAVRRARPQWGDSLRPFLWTHVGDDGARASRGCDRGRPAGRRAPTTSRSRRPSTCTRSTTARSRSLLLFCGTVFARRDGGFVGRAGRRGTRRRRTGCRSRCGGT